MPDTSDSLSALLKRTTQKAVPATSSPPVEPDGSDTVSLAEMNGSQTPRAANRNLTRIHIIDKTGKVRSFQYNYLDSETIYDGNSFTLIFTGVKHWQVTVKGHGKKFWDVYDSITLHRWPYIREAAGSMPGANADGEVVFTKIEFRDITPKPESQD